MVARKRVELPRRNPFSRLSLEALERHFSQQLESNARTLNELLEAGIKECVVLAHDHACDECSGRDGQELPVDDMAHLPPYHLGCRCTIHAP